MGKFASLLRFLSVNAIVACITVGIALGVSNVLINHVHWLGAYLIACPARSWDAQSPHRPVSEAITSGAAGLAGRYRARPPLSRTTRLADR